jgi:hypothetical protein
VDRITSTIEHKNCELVDRITLTTMHKNFELMYKITSTKCISVSFYTRFTY